jgi:kumamolisin
VTPGWDPNIVTTVSNCGSKVVVVDAFDNPSALADLTLFSSQFGLPAPTPANFQVVYATGVQPANDTGWALEEALDIEMAHAMAPNAKVILVEAASNSTTDLLFAEDVASGLVATAGGDEVSNSWGGDEFAGQLALDTHFSTPKVVYFASTGDTPGVSAIDLGECRRRRGDEHISLALYCAFRFESSWSDGGGGSSAIVPRPAYQNSIRPIVGTQRGVPNISADANPITGVWVACGPGCGQPPGTWYTVGGTSVSSALVASMTNGAGRFAPNTASELRTIYANSEYPRFGPWRRFNNVVHGICGPFAGYATNDMNGWVPLSWDFCTGVGSPKGLSGL